MTQPTLKKALLQTDLVSLLEDPKKKNINLLDVSKVTDITGLMFI